MDEISDDRIRELTIAMIKEFDLVIASQFIAHMERNPDIKTCTALNEVATACGFYSDQLAVRFEIGKDLELFSEYVVFDAVDSDLPPLDKVLDGTGHDWKQYKDMYLSDE